MPTASGSAAINGWTMRPARPLSKSSRRSSRGSATQITFPAAILQPPFFDPNADTAANYGAIGAVIGHEMGHGFDNEGRKFDPTGKLRDWWSADAAKSFTTRTDALVAQYNGFFPWPDLHVNGKLTLGENI